MFHRWCRMLWSWAVPSLRHTFFFPSFWYRLIFISAIQRLLFQKWSGFFRCFLSKSNLALFAACGEPCVFVLVKSSLDCRHIYLLESVLLLAGCGERVFLYHGEDSLIIHHWCPPWTSRPFYVSEITDAFFFYQCTKLLIWPLLNVPAISLMDLFCFWSLTIICFSCMESSFDHIMWVHSNSFQMQMAHLESTPDLLPA